jgi:hypothetical protein
MDDGQRIGWGEMASHCQIDQLNLKFEKIEIESPKNYCLLDFFVKTDKIDKKTNSLELTPHETYPLRPPPRRTPPITGFATEFTAGQFTDRMQR